MVKVLYATDAAVVMNAREILKEYGISSEVRTMKSMTNLGLMRDGYYSMKLNLSDLCGNFVCTVVKLSTAKP